MDLDPEEVWSAENGAAYKAATARKDAKPESKPIEQARTRKICMRLTRPQKKLLKVWMGAYRLTYNKAVELVRRDLGWRAASCQYLNEHLVYESKNGNSSRTNASSSKEEVEASNAKTDQMEAKRTKLGVQVGWLVAQHPWLKEVPSCIRKEACRDVCKAYTSNEAKPRRKFRIGFKNRKDDSAWTLSVPLHALTELVVEPRPETSRKPRKDGQPHKETTRRNWTKLHIAPSTKLGPVWLTEAVPVEAIKTSMKGQGKSKRPWNELKHGVRITLDKRDRFHCCVSYLIEPTPATTKPAAERKVGAVDPGDRVRATVYSPSDGEVVLYAEGKNRGGKDRLYKHCKAIDALDAQRRELVAKKKFDQVRKIKRRMVKLRQRVQNLVTEANRKMALDMVRRWDTLILPPFKTKDMVKRKRGGRRTLSSKVARSLMTWRSYDFRILTKRLFLRHSGEVIEAGEEFTTMTCGACGRLNAKHSNEEWTCKHCNTFHLRDPAASRCIFIKALGRNATVQPPVARSSPLFAESTDDEASQQWNSTTRPPDLPLSTPLHLSPMQISHPLPRVPRSCPVLVRNATNCPFGRAGWRKQRRR
jgi:transposase